MLATHASATSLAAYTLLLTEPSLVLGAACGIAGFPTKLWQSLTALVRARETAMLHDVAARASTLEGRAAAVVGLVKVGAVPKGEGVAMLASLHGPITRCGGCVIEKWNSASDVAYLFDEPLDGDPWDMPGAVLDETPRPIPIPNPQNQEAPSSRISP